MGFLLYLLLSVALLDGIRLMVKATPLIYGVAALSLTLLVCFYGILNASHLRTTEFTVPVKGLTHEDRYP